MLNKAQRVAPLKLHIFNMYDMLVALNIALNKPKELHSQLKMTQQALTLQSYKNLENFEYIVKAIEIAEEFIDSSPEEHHSSRELLRRLCLLRIECEQMIANSSPETEVLNEIVSLLSSELYSFYIRNQLVRANVAYQKVPLTTENYEELLRIIINLTSGLDQNADKTKEVLQLIAKLETYKILS